jgi:protein-disulfide isomerase
LRQIEEAYLKTGKVRFGYLHLIIKGKESQWAAEASECAGEQSEKLFWAYHDKLFAVATGENPIPFNPENLKGFAAELGLDPQAFSECLDSGRYGPVVQADTQTAWFLNFRATPSFLINGKPLVGAQPFEVFSDYIESALNP